MGEVKNLNIVEKDRKSNLWSTEEALQKVLDDIKAEKIKPTSAIIILIEEDDQQYERPRVVFVNQTVASSTYYLFQVLHGEAHRAYQ